MITAAFFIVGGGLLFKSSAAFLLQSDFALRCGSSVGIN